MNSSASAVFRLLSWVGLWAFLSGFDEPQSFALERMRTTLDREGIISVESARTPKHLDWHLRFWAGYQSNPLVIVRASNGERLGALVQERTGGWLLGSIGLFDFAQLGLELPMTFQQWRPSGLIPGITSAELSPIASNGLGDLRVVPKLRLFQSASESFAVALLAPVTLPTGGATGYRGDSNVSISPEIAASFQSGAWRFASNFAVPLRSRIQILTKTVEPEFFFGLGGAYRFFKEDSASLPLELALSLNSYFPRSEPLTGILTGATETRASISWWLNRHLQFSVGGGAALANGWGSPDWRAFGGFSYTGFSPPQKKTAPPVESQAQYVPPSTQPTPQPEPQPEPETPPAPETPLPTPVEEEPKRVAQPEPLPSVEILDVVYFAFDVADIETAAQPVVERVAVVMKARPDLKIRIEGHTDNMGAAEVNRRLSLRRAETVKRLLVEKGIEASRLSTVGHGFDRPAESNSSAAGRARNRRVIFVVIEQEKARSE